MSTSPKYRAIVAHFDPDMQRHISCLLEETDLFQVIFTTRDGEECMKEAIRLQPDIIVAETVLSSIDGVEVLRRTKALCNNIKMLLLTNYNELMKNHRSLESADYSILAPYTDPLLVERAIELVRPSSNNTFSTSVIANQSAAVLSILGAPRHLKGYILLNDAIQLVVLDPKMIHRHTGSTGLYAQLCSRHNESYRNVERCIRSLGAHIFTHTSLSVLEKYFSEADLARGHVTNFTLISTLAAHVTNDLQILQCRGLLSNN